MNPSQHKTVTKDEEEDAGSEKEECGAAKEANSITDCHNNLELRLGVPSSSTTTSIFRQAISVSSGSTDQAVRAAVIHNLLRMNGLEPSWLFSDPSNRLIDPWSLAARQQKAVLEQAHKSTRNPSSTSPSHALPREPQPPPPSVAVGWPPVRSFRRNMVSSQAPRPEVEDERKAKRAKFDEEEAFNGYDEVKGAMFVKVNMEGYAVGRKIDLKSLVSYDSLSDSLKKMFLNFLSLDYSEEYKMEAPNHDFLLLYEDHEGDRMLVGDVPWEMFLTSVKRLYIVRSPKPQALEEIRVSASAEMDAKDYAN